jgi:squalene-hopene/tetraprenyl-beta-curcumene cyclase
MTAERYQRAGTWIAKHQNSDGGWGELPRSYDDPTLKGVGPSTPSQTAWALMALFALNDITSETVRRGVDYLLRVQQYDGSWKDAFWTGTGFPKVFYLRYHLYATYFPLWALSLLKRQVSTERAGTRTAERVPTPAPATTSTKVAVRRTRE